VLMFGTDSQFVDMRFDAGSPPSLVAYLAPEGFVPELREEIGDKIANVYGRLIVAHAPVSAAAWLANVWLDPIPIPIRSVGDGAPKLRAMQRNWALYSFASHRRAALIEERLPSVSAKPIVFGADPPKAALGSWTLIDANTILASANCASAFPNGVVGFVQDRRAPLAVPISSSGSSLRSSVADHRTANFASTSAPVREAGPGCCNN
jgi:23S rRNA (cytidine2498-2'-O)-methyltransferase